MNTTILLIVIAAVAVVAIAAYIYERNRSSRLRSRFGPEYNRAVQETGSKYRAESSLEKLEKRVDKFAIHPLQPEAASRFRESWRIVQAEFVDDPRKAVGDADRLLTEAMTAMGYPINDFDERAAEISVNHAHVVEHYRAGHTIALSHAKGRATTEDMRQAMIHYRVLFDDLLGVPDVPRVRARAAGGSL